jgi:hypothetical protein
LESGMIRVAIIDDHPASGTARHWPRTRTALA